MLERQKRLNEVYEHLHNNFGVHTKGEFADIIKYARAYISSAMNGNDRYLTDKLFTNICEAYPGTFNLEYLLTGNGDLLTTKEEVHNEELKKQSYSIDQGSLVNAALAAKDEAIESLKRELQTKNDLIQSLREQLESKDQLIAEQKARLIEYRRIIDSNSLETYPFHVGVSDGKSQQKVAK